MFNKEIAVLITCHNRKEKTLACLTALYNCIIPDNYIFEVYLVDDGSTDGTSQAVKDNFPQVNIILGNGNLYWNQGMRLALETAAKTKEYDFYLWLNDDTILENDAIIELLNCSNEALQKNNMSAIITGACKNTTNKKEFSYGGRTEKGAVVPNGLLQNCKYINGNAVLVPNVIFEKLGNLSSDYTHGMGDYDYGLRALQEGFMCYSTKKYIAVCNINEGLPNWCNPRVSLYKRWQHFKSPLGLNIKEYNKFRKKFWGIKWVSFSIKAYSKMLFPNIYTKLTQI